MTPASGLIYTFEVFQLGEVLHWKCKDARHNVIGSGDTIREALDSAQNQVVTHERNRLLRAALVPL